MVGAPEHLAAWRKDQRRALIARRMAVDAATLERWRLAMDRHIERGFPGLAKGVLGFCWPYRNEYDARHLAARLRRAGAITALPVVVAPRAPLVFREWHPGMMLEKGPLGIPYPANSRELQPDTVLLPMVGFDAAGYRLGYGAGYFDRTMAALARRPMLIGVAHELARMETIFPQAHDIAVDWIVTERGIYRRDAGALAFLGAPAQAEARSLDSTAYYAEESDPRRDR